MKEKGNRKKVHGLSWQLANEKKQYCTGSTGPFLSAAGQTR